MYILECEGIIYGVGATPEAAIADAREFVEIDTERVEILDGDRYYPAGCVAVWPATRRLVDAVRRDSHGLRWGWNRSERLADTTEPRNA